MGKEEVMGPLRYVLSGVIATLLMIFFFCSWTVIQPGNAGVLFNSITGSLHTEGQGIALKIPFVTSIRSYPVSLRTYTMVRKSGEGSSTNDDSIDLPTLEGQHIRQDVSITYNTTQDKAAEVFRAFKGADIDDIETTFIRRTIITIMQNAAGSLSLVELISTKRGQLQELMQVNLTKELSKMGFTLDKVNLGASHLPESIEAQMQKKMAAQQEAQQAEYALQKAKTLAKAAVETAHGEADAELVLAEAKAKSNKLLRESLTAELIRLRSIEKWDGVLPVITSGATPIVDARELIGKK